MKKPIAALLLALAGAQVAPATENDANSEPGWLPRKFVSAETAQFRLESGRRSYDLADRYNP